MMATGRDVLATLGACTAGDAWSALGTQMGAAAASPELGRGRVGLPRAVGAVSELGYSGGVTSKRYLEHVLTPTL